MANKILTWIISILTLLAGLGGGVKLSENDFDNAYVCPLSDEVKLLDSLTQDGRIGYYTEDEVQRSFECKLGDSYESWIPLRTYVAMTGTNSVDLIKMSVDKSGTTWECDFDSCYLVE
jgi:hypothetical protein